MMHESWEHYWIQGWGIDPDLWRERMGMLEFEEAKAVFNPHNAFYQREHPLDFDCQCKECTKKTTITMWDRNFLYSIGVSWSRYVSGPVGRKKVREAAGDPVHSGSES